MRKVIVAALGAWMVLLAGCSSDPSSAPPGDDDDDATDAGATGTDAEAAPQDATTAPVVDASSSADATFAADAAGDSAAPGDDDAASAPDATADASEPEDAGPDATADAGADAAPDASPPPPPPPTMYTVGGKISGLTGSVILKNEGGDALTVSANGVFTFATSLTAGQPYAVTVSQQPALPANDSCVPTLATGVVGAGPVTSVVVTCTIAPPDTITTGVDVITTIDTSSGRIPISPLLYGINGEAGDSYPAALLKGVTFIRRGGDRGNSYDWETNVSNGGIENGYASDLTLTAGIPNPNAPAGQDLTALQNNRAAGRATMVPFILNDYVAKQVVDYIPWDQPGFVRTDYFNKETILKPTPYATTPNLTDGVVYTDEQLAYMRAQFPDDILAAGPTRLIIGIDNECDLWDYNFPMLQTGQGAAIPANANGASTSSIIVGNQVTANEFFQRVISFTTKVKTLAPQSFIVGPSHYGFDGFRAWNLPSSPMYPPLGHWFMDDFLPAMKNASEAAGIRLLDTWDFHWYPQQTFGNTTVSALDNNQAGGLTAAEITAIIQGPRSYWDQTYNENSWITDAYHLNGPAYILTRLQQHIAAGYPGTPIGVSEYFPGGLNHISSGMATADTLGVFQREGIELAAMWPNGSNNDCRFAFGGIELLRNADGNGLAYAATNVAVTNPDLAQSSVYAGMDTPGRVTMLVVNKTSATRTFGLEITNAEKLGKVAIYTIDAAHASPYLAKNDTLTKSNAYAFAAGSMSASMLVFTTP